MTQTYLVSLFLLCSSSLALSQTTAIVGGRIHTVSGEVIEEGTVLLEDGRIRAVGASVHIPSGARRIESAGKIVTPGLIDVGTSIGLLEVKSLADTTDFSVGGKDAIRAAFRVSDGLNPHSIVIPITRLGGVTTVATMPSGGALSGQGAIIDLDGTTATDLIVRDPAALYGAFNPGAAESAGGARGALALLLRESLDDARYYAMNKNAYDRAVLRSLSLSRLDLEALQIVLDKSVPLILHASRAADIEAALRLAAEYELDLTIMGAEEAWRRREQLAATGTAVIVKAYRNLPIQFDQLGSRFDNAILLVEAGVQVVLSTLDTHNARNLRFEAGQAVRHGMKWQDALRAVTLSPAEVMRISETHGSLEAGKVANVVVWSGDPFEPASFAEHLFIKGREIEHDSRQKRLFERYKSLEGRPVQYLGMPTSEP